MSQAAIELLIELNKANQQIADSRAEVVKLQKELQKLKDRFEGVEKGAGRAGTAGTNRTKAAGAAITKEIEGIRRLGKVTDEQRQALQDLHQRRVRTRLKDQQMQRSAAKEMRTLKDNEVAFEAKVQEKRSQIIEKHRQRRLQETLKEQKTQRLGREDVGGLKRAAEDFGRDDFIRRIRERREARKREIEQGIKSIKLGKFETENLKREAAARGHSTRASRERTAAAKQENAVRMRGGRFDPRMGAAPVPMGVAGRMRDRVKDVDSLRDAQAKGRFAMFQYTSAAQDLAIVLQNGGTFERALLGASNNLGVMASAAGGAKAVLGTAAVIAIPTLVAVLRQSAGPFQSFSSKMEMATDRTREFTEEADAAARAQRRLTKAVEDFEVAILPEDEAKKQKEVKAIREEAAKRVIASEGFSPVLQETARRHSEAAVPREPILLMKQRQAELQREVDAFRRDPTRDKEGAIVETPKFKSNLKELNNVTVDIVKAERKREAEIGRRTAETLSRLKELDIKDLSRIFGDQFTKPLRKESEAIAEEKLNAERAKGKEAGIRRAEDARIQLQQERVKKEQEKLEEIRRKTRSRDQRQIDKQQMIIDKEDDALREMKNAAEQRREEMRISQEIKDEIKGVRDAMGVFIEIANRNAEGPFALPDQFRNAPVIPFFPLGGP